MSYRRPIMWWLSILWLACCAATVQAKDSAYQLFVKAVPADAKITIWNIKTPFKQGMRLAPGRYDLQVHRPGYVAYREWVTIKDQPQRLTVTLQAKPVRLFIDATPADAAIKIWNVKEPYTPGMTLRAGKYDIQVSSPGYKTYRATREIHEQDARLNIVLEAETQAPLAAPTLAAQGGYPLTITTDPPDAEISLRNIVPKFTQGMLLAPGKYDVQVARPGYETRRRWVEIANQPVYLDISLRPDGNLAGSGKKASGLRASAKPGEYSLYVYPNPADATVRVMNIKPPFISGIRLPPGRYQLQVSKPGYPMRTQWVEIRDQDLSLAINLSEAARCFALPAPDGGQVDLTFYDQYVDALYTQRGAAGGIASQFRLVGARQGKQLDLIGTVYYGSQPTELRSAMTLEANRLVVDFDGETRTLPEISCQR